MGEIMPENQKRQTAFNTIISEISTGNYVKEEGWQPNYVLTSSGKKISRANIAGVIIAPPAEESGSISARIDDGSDSINIRGFDNPKLFDGINVGDAVFVIGRPRQYDSETYLLAEIVKKIDDMKWIELRKLQIEKDKTSEPIPAEEKSGESKPISIEELPKRETEEIKIGKEKEEIESVGEEKKEMSLPEKVYSIIKEIDGGQGAAFEEVAAKAGENSEKIIKSLLMDGEIFEVSPGKLKVLE